jgi:hypothetical protein
VNPSDVYLAIRSEIVTNHVLIHVVTLVAFGSLLAGAAWTETRHSVVSVLLPLLSVAWAASVVRFDYFIHRQGAYLRALEAEFQSAGPGMPLWETWKAALGPARMIVAAMDVVVFGCIVAVTAYLSFGPAREYLRVQGWHGAAWYPWVILASLSLLLLLLAFIPHLSHPAAALTAGGIHASAHARGG